MWKINGQGRLQPLLNVPGIPEPTMLPASPASTYWQTDHIDAIVFRNQGFLSGDIILLVIDLPIW
jgi:hypothetical protein